jgi:adenylate cyclase
MTQSMGLRLKLVLATALVLTVMSTGLTALKLVQIESEREASLVQQAERLGDALASAMATPIWDYDADAARPPLEALKEAEAFVQVLVIDDTGREFCRVTQPDRLDEPGLLELSRDVAAAPSTGRGGQKIGEVRLTFSRRGLRELKRRSLRTDLFALLVLLGATVGVISMTIRAFTRPIVDMTALMERRSQGDYESEVPRDYTRRFDEIGAIARSLERDQKRRREELHMLELTRVIARELDLELLLGMIAATATQLLEAERSSIFLHDPESDTLISKVAEGLEGASLSIGSDEGVAGAVFTSGERINLADVSVDSRFSDRVDHATGFKTHNLLCEPLVTQEGARIGVVQVLNRRDGAFAEREEKLLEAFAAQAVVAIEKARLFRDVVAMKNYNESILNSLSDGVLSMDEELIITKLNPAASRILQRPAADLVGQPVTAITSEGSWVHDALGRVRSKGRPDTTLDRELRLPGGAGVSVNATALRLQDEQGASSGFMLILSDISAEKRVRGTMARYMPKEIVDQLLETEEGALGGAAQTVTTLFSDIRSFTTISESIGPKATVTLLNEYFTDMIEVLEAHEGIVDKYIGDAVMAIFGAPFVSERDAGNAVAAANAMMASLAELNKRRRARGEMELAIGVGLNTGEVVLGNIGSPKRMDYTVVGDAVNLAARLEGVTKTYGAEIVLSEFTYRELEDKSAVRELDLIRVKGKTEPVPIYESYAYKLSAAGEALPRAMESYSRGLSAYRAQSWDQAEEAFRTSLDLCPGDVTSALYLERIAGYRASPPPEGWDGVFTFTTK